MWQHQAHQYTHNKSPRRRGQIEKAERIYAEIMAEKCTKLDGRHEST